VLAQAHPETERAGYAYPKDVPIEELISSENAQYYAVSRVLNGPPKGARRRLQGIEGLRDLHHQRPGRCEERRAALEQG